MVLSNNKTETPSSKKRGGKLLEKSDYIMKKNVALDKENKRFDLAFKQSMVEKEEIRKELASQSEALNDLLIKPSPR